MLGQILSGLFGGLFFEHDIIIDAEAYEDNNIQSAFYHYDKQHDDFDVGLIIDGDRVTLHTYATEGDADHAAGRLARHFGVGIQS